MDTDFKGVIFPMTDAQWQRFFRAVRGGRG
jgi:hypothetical protein